MKKLAPIVLEKSHGLCKNCSSYGTELHHIISGSGKRKQHQNEHSVILLCSECHRGQNGVHGKNGNILNIKLKQDLQELYFEQGYSEDKVREKMGGRLY